MTVKTVAQADRISDCIGLFCPAPILNNWQEMEHRGFSLIDILQPCVSFNHKDTYQWHTERVYKVEDESGYNSGDKISAFAKAQEWGNRIPIGLIYRKEKPPALEEMTLVKQKINLLRFEGLLEEFL